MKKVLIAACLLTMTSVAANADESNPLILQSLGDSNVAIMSVAEAEATRGEKVKVETPKWTKCVGSGWFRRCVTIGGSVTITVPIVTPFGIIYTKY